MEYSKEDLMEAKKQILGVGENMGTEESKKIWEENAQFWDNAMGDESNEFHRDVGLNNVYSVRIESNAKALCHSLCCSHYRFNLIAGQLRKLLNMTTRNHEAMTEHSGISRKEDHDLAITSYFTNFKVFALNNCAERTLMGIHGRVYP